jgi:hypothetical protein
MESELLASASNWLPGLSSSAGGAGCNEASYPTMRQGSLWPGGCPEKDSQRGQFLPQRSQRPAHSGGLPAA